MEIPADHRAVDRREPTPVYLQLADSLRASIADGSWPAHHRLPAEPELAAERGVSRGTLRKALGILVAEGLVRRVHGRGTFVLPHQVPAPFGSELSTVYEELIKRGVDFTTSVLVATHEPAGAEVAAALGIDPGASVLHLERVRFDDISPIAYLVNYVRSVPGDGLGETDFSRVALFEALEGRLGCTLAYGRRTMRAVSADQALALQLDVPPGAPLLLLEQVTCLADGTAVECSDSWINPARMSVSSVVQRSRADDAGATPHVHARTAMRPRARSKQEAARLAE